MKRFTNKQACLKYLTDRFETAKQAMDNKGYSWEFKGLGIVKVAEAFRVAKHTDLDSNQQLEQRVVQSFEAEKQSISTTDKLKIEVDGYNLEFSDSMFVKCSDENNGNFDAVEKPKHYQFFDGVEAIELIAASMTQEQFYGYCLGNKLKYRLRAGEKDDIQQDINKSNKYEELYELHKGKCKRAVELSDVEVE